MPVWLVLCCHLAELYGNQSGCSLSLLIKLWNIFMSPNINNSFTQEVLLFKVVIQKVINLFYFEFCHVSILISCLFGIMQLYIHLLKT